MRSPYVGVAIGLWYMVAPFVWGYPFGFLWWNSLIIGAIVIGVSISFALSPTRLQGWLLIAIGAYSLLSPFLNDYISLSFPLWNDLVFGVLTVGTGTAVGGAGLQVGSADRGSSAGRGSPAGSS